MKTVVLSFVIAVIVFTIVSVESASMPNCGSCNESECPKFNCECGTHKDMCGCCDFCTVCPGRACSLMRNEVCSDGYTCAYPAGSDHYYMNQHDGLCVRA